jgi:hypothetical protein
MSLSRRKKLLFGLIAMTLSFVAVTGLLLVADLVVLHGAERWAGLNRYGYRGPVVRSKQPGELRVVMLGGSTVFGYGVAWNESIPAYLEAQLRAKLTRKVTVVNLGFNNQGAFAFVPDLEDFAYLDYDVIVLYEGYNDLPGDEGPNRAVYRRDSAIYRALGYYPILPLYLEEKARTLRFGNVNAAYESLQKKDGGQVVFQPGLAQRTSAAALEAVSSMTKALDGQLEKTAAAAPPAVATTSELGCEFPYVMYCGSVASAIRFGRAHGDGVVVGLQPHLAGARSDELHTRQRATLSAMVGRVFGSDAQVTVADLSHLIDLKSAEVTFDGMHLNPEANARVAAALVDPVLKVVAGK